VEFPPELGGERRQKPVEDLKPVDQGVVGGAERDEQTRPGDAGPAVVDVEAALGAFPFSAETARPAVALEDARAESAEEE
jgi:hypothetical protein